MPEVLLVPVGQDSTQDKGILASGLMQSLRVRDEALQERATLRYFLLTVGLDVGRVFQERQGCRYPFITHFSWCSLSALFFASVPFCAEMVCSQQSGQNGLYHRV